MVPYEVLRSIDAGGFGRVVAARLKPDGTIVAIKQLHESCTDEDILRFAREVRLTSSLNHRNIVPILSANLADHPPWFVMPLAKYNLRKVLPTVAGSMADVWRIFSQVLDAMEYAHAQGIIHRDLKPENILFFDESDQHDVVKVSDFGLGRRLDRDTTTITHTHQQMGTWAYMAPEQVTDAKNADHRADIYALGKILYELVTGDLPVAIDERKLPNGLDWVVMKCLAADPGDRYQSVANVRSDLEPLFTQAGRAFKEPRKVGRELLDALLANAPEIDPCQLEEFARFLLEHRNDDALYLSIVPDIRPPLLDAFLRLRPLAFFRLLRHYDQLVSGPLAFEYTDKVADFYENIFRRAEDRRVRQLILTRLLLMGYSHHRFHVRDVFCRIVEGLTDPSTILLVREILLAHPTEAAWHAQRLDYSKLPEVLQSTIDIITSRNLKRDDRDDETFNL